MEVLTHSNNHLFILPGLITWNLPSSQLHFTLRLSDVSVIKLFHSIFAAWWSICGRCAVSTITTPLTSTRCFPRQHSAFIMKRSIHIPRTTSSAVQSAFQKLLNIIGSHVADISFPLCDPTLWRNFVLSTQKEKFQFRIEENVMIFVKHIHVFF